MSKANHLINEKSPYLLQHARNPVDWYPWGEEAFDKARIEYKPIFLSIGYSTCYWCHVMEREVFENEKIAELMNRYFVNIKVDREERPDIDRVYMSALQSLTGSGGWPMSMFLTPELKPFYGATYVPPKSKYGLPGFEVLCEQIHKTWAEKSEELKKASSKIIEQLSPSVFFKPIEQTLSKEILDKAFEQMQSIFDDQYGGFGNAPKFPRPSVLNFLLRYYYRNDNKGALMMVVRTLMNMARGGMYDQLGGGFHRYSVDRFWRVPHFEKMLYDQAQMAISYIEAYQVTCDESFKNIAEEILDYVLKKFRDKDGGFYSAEDAESRVNSMESGKKEEGAFYVWTKEEIKEILSGDELDIFCYCYDIGDRGNVPINSDPHNVFTDKNVLYLSKTISDASNKFKKPTDEVQKILYEAKRKVFESREKRPHPFLDDKILTSWNGLMISAFAKAGMVFGKESYYETAKSATDFIFTKLYGDKGKILLHRYRDGESKIEATLEDYAFYGQSLIDLYESGFDDNYLELAVELTDRMVEIFCDEKMGGFFDVSGKDKSVLIRSKEDYDSAEPSGNSIAIMNLLRLSQLLKNDKYYSIAEESLKYFSNNLSSNPYSSPQMLCSLDYILTPVKQIVIAGKMGDSVLKEMLNEINKTFIPDKVLICCDRDNIPEPMSYLIRITKPSEKTLAYICENFSCKLPVDNVEELKRSLNMD